MSFISNIFKRNKSKSNIEFRSVQAASTDFSTATNAFSLFASNKWDAVQNSAFYAAKELICSSIAQLPIQIKFDSKVTDNHYLSFIFDTDIISKYILIKQLLSDVFLYGNGYAYIHRDNSGRPSKLQYLSNGKCSPIYNSQNNTLYYSIPTVSSQLIEPINVIHLLKNSNDGVNGISLITYAQQMLSLATATDKQASKYYESGCAVTGALTIFGSRRGAKEAARAAFQEAHGINGSGLIILDDDTKYTPISANANDSQMLETRQFNIKEIARFFNINPVLLGIDDNATATEEVNIAFVKHTLLPYIVMIENEFNNKLILPSDKQHLSIDLDESFLLRANKAETASYYSTLVSSGIMTINEARQQLNLSEQEGADRLLIPYTNVEQNIVNTSNDTNEVFEYNEINKNETDKRN